MGSFAGSRVGVYVDGENIRRSGGYGMRYDVLREFACRNGGEAMRLNAYLSYNREDYATDKEYRNSIEGFHTTLRDFGYKVVRKEVKWIWDEKKGERYPKANADLDMAVDLLLQSEHLDHILLVTGDGDFVQVVRALQNKGCRVEVVAFENVSADLQREADMFINGYLIPNLLATQSSNREWGEVGSRVRGTSYYCDPERGFGFFRFFKKGLANIWIADTRRDDSAYHTAHFSTSELPADVKPSELPSRSTIFEFTLVRPPKPDADRSTTDIRLIRN